MGGGAGSQLVTQLSPSNAAEKNKCVPSNFPLAPLEVHAQPLFSRVWGITTVQVAAGWIPLGKGGQGLALFRLLDAQPPSPPRPEKDFLEWAVARVVHKRPPWQFSPEVKTRFCQNMGIFGSFFLWIFR